MKNILIGTDILSISRLKEKLENNENLYNKIFTNYEQDYAKKKGKHMFETLAGIYSAKESLIKIFSKMSNNSFSFFDFEIKHKNKIPYVNILNENIQKYSESIDISISHEKEFAIANAVLFLNI